MMGRSNVKVMRSVCLLVVGYISLQLGHPQSAIADRGCSKATLRGTYIWSNDGWQIDGNVRKPFAFSGMETYDGKGNMTRGIFSGGTDGAIDRNVEYTGTYTVNPDCTGAQVFTETLSGGVTHFDAFIAPSGDEFTFVQTDTGFVTVGSERRVKHRVLKPEHDK